MPFKIPDAAELDGKRILVFGDIILDRYTWGDAERVSPEAPVMVLRAADREVRLGGAASVACLLRHLGVEVRLVGIVGDDADGRTVQRLANEAGISGNMLLRDGQRCTTTKERFLGMASGGGPQQLLRVDYEENHDIDAATEERIRCLLAEAGSDCDVWLVSDYRKGVCTPGVLKRLFAAAENSGVPVVVDPARRTDYARYAGATLLKPNRVETALATDRSVDCVDDVLAVGAQLRRVVAADAVVVTLDRDGMAMIDAETTRLFPTTAQSVFDITGAGDTVLAMLGIGYALRWPLAETVHAANIAAGLQIRKLGVAPIAWKEIAGEQCTDRRDNGKLLTDAELLTAVAEHRRNGRSVVFTNGCFDLLHAGHVAYLREAATLGDVLIVAVNSDRSVRELKGAGRPINTDQQRAAVVAALECVDHVIVFDELEPRHLLGTIRPDVLVKGGDYCKDQIVGGDFVESYGGRVCITSHVQGLSTSTIIGTLRQDQAVQRQRQHVEAGTDQCE